MSQSLGWPLGPRRGPAKCPHLQNSADGFISGTRDAPLPGLPMTNVAEEVTP